MESKIKIDLDNVQETLLLPLWGRATESQKEKPKLVDSKAVEIVNKIDYDFSTIAKNISWVSQLSWVARCLEYNVNGSFQNRLRNGITYHSSTDWLRVTKLQVLAIQDGIPYQTLMSSVLHKYASGRL